MKHQVFVCADPRFEADMGNLVKLLGHDLSQSEPCKATVRRDF